MASTWRPSGMFVKRHSWVQLLNYSFISVDQTTRIHGEASTEPGSSSKSWHEIGRPQVHGYDLLGVAFLDPLRFVSIADEKVARVFEAPQEFVDVVQNLDVADLKEAVVCLTLDVAVAGALIGIQEERPRAATVPPLGLSNKAVTDRTYQWFTLFARYSHVRL